MILRNLVSFYAVTHECMRMVQICQLLHGHGQHGERENVHTDDCGEHDHATRGKRRQVQGVSPPESGEG
jgi:hypothetical protein